MITLTVKSYGDPRNAFTFTDMKDLREHVEQNACPPSNEYSLTVDSGDEWETIITTNSIGEIMGAVDEIEGFISTNDGAVSAGVIAAVYDNQHGHIADVEVFCLPLDSDLSDEEALGRALVEEGLYVTQEERYFDYEALGRDELANGYYISYGYAISEL